MPRARIGFFFILFLLSFDHTFAQSPLVIRPELDTRVAPRYHLPLPAEGKRPRVALVLSGGGARGIAQIGVLKVFEEKNIPVDFIAATSLGAVVGGLYAAGYSVAELESIAVSTNWDEVLSLTGDTERSDLFVDQKVASDRTFISLRFKELEPVIPSAVSSGQRVTNFLSTLTLQAVHHPETDFDDLRIPFRAVATDLISGQRVVMRDGPLAEALRASSTVPLLFSPVERDSLRLLDGGLVSNIPVDIAREEGYDLVVAVNTTSGMRREDELTAPWQAADQIMGIMMQSANKEQLEQADFVITPDLGRHLSSDFTDIQGLISKGMESARPIAENIAALFDSLSAAGGDTAQLSEGNVRVEVRNPSSIVLPQPNPRSLTDVRSAVGKLYGSGNFRDVRAEVYMHEDPVRVVYFVTPNPPVLTIAFEGNTLLTGAELVRRCEPLIGQPLNAVTVDTCLDDVIRLYRKQGYSLARIASVAMDTVTGTLRVGINEGIVRNIDVVGTERTADYVVRREFPISEGDVFRIDHAQEGMARIAGTTLFESVQLDVAFREEGAAVRIRLTERPSQLLSLGMRIDNERNLQGLIEMRDDNVFGTGSSLGLSISGGSRNQEYLLGFNSYRLFDSYVSFDFGLFYKVFDSYFYVDEPVMEENRWDRDQAGEYRDRRYGGSVAFGAQLEKFGNASVRLTLQHVAIEDKDNAASLVQDYDLAVIRLGTVIDSKNSYPFPTTGIGLNFGYEFAVEALGGEESYNALSVGYEMFATFGGVHTIHPRATVGFADKTMPFGEQYRLGGLESMFGTREDDRRGRQLLLLNVEYRWKFPVKILFDTYLSVRYDLGTISEVPEQITLSSFRHGLGAELAFDTPVGPASIGVGRSFYFLSTTAHPIQKGPYLFYFVVGYHL